MKTPRLIIRKYDVKKDLPYEYKDLIGEFDIIEEIRKRGNNPSDLAWFIINCWKARSFEILEYFKFLKPHYTDVSLVISEALLTEEDMLDFYISLKPDYKDVCLLLTSCKFAQTNEMINFYLSLKPDYDNVMFLIKYLNNENIRNVYKYIYSFKNNKTVKTKITTVTIDDLELKCHYYYVPPDERVGIMYGYVEIFKVVYNGVDVTKLIDTIDFLLSQKNK
jgi:hypothetical protein